MRTYRDAAHHRPATKPMRQTSSSQGQTGSAAHADCQVELIIEGGATRDWEKRRGAREGTLAAVPMVQVIDLVLLS
jgi:hypothetical protein